MIVNIHCYSCQIKKQFYRMNGMRVFTVIFSAASVDLDRHSFLINLDLPCHEFSFGTSLAKVRRDVCQVFVFVLN